jgi:pyruvate dehydrogenase E1 component
MYLFKKGAAANGPRVQLMGSGVIFREAIAAAEMLRNDWGVESDLWSCPSFTELARDGHNCVRHQLLHPEEPKRLCHVAKSLADTRGPVVAATDYVRLFAEQIRPFVTLDGRRYTVLGTDGFGRSDYRVKLRSFFEVDRHHVSVAALKALADEGAVDPTVVQAAIERYEIDADADAPWTR